VRARARSWTHLNSKRARIGVLLIGLTAFLPKLLISMRTFGTQDIHTWEVFAQGVSQWGTVGIYRHHALNYPPLVGDYLLVINKLSQWGVSLRVTIRVVSSAADVVSGLLVFEILRRRGSLLRSTISGIAVAASPVLFLISGYHGQTDPLFVMLVLLGSFLVIDKRMALLGGVALGLAIGIKLVPIVVLPTIAVYLFRQHRGQFVRGAAGFGMTFAATWGPAILHEWDGLKRNVLEYAGINDHPWGLVRLTDGLNWSWASQFMIGPGRFTVLLLCALIPAALTWQRPQLAMESAAMSLVAFLILSPAFSVQYLAWAVAAGYLLDFWSATLYNVLGGLLLFLIYNHWNGGLPWTGLAKGQLYTPYEGTLAALVWTVLIAILIRGAHRAISGGDSRHLAFGRAG
jgi:Gpi18-like mannosyltransferase